jgi:hypothetical protein
MPDQGTQISVSEGVTTVSVAEDVTTINIAPTVTTVEAKGLAISLVNAAALPFVPHGSVTATNVQDALEQLADQDFRTTETPTGPNVGEGDTWYDIDDNQLKVYRETSNGVFEWVPIIVGAAADDSDTLDAGAF